MTAQERRRTATAPDQAAITIGVGSLVSSVFTLADGDPWEIVTMPAVAVIVALVLGAVACAAGLLGRPLPARVVGGAFLVAALVVLLELALGTDWTHGNGSTMALWAGLGIGLLAAGFAPRDT
jgi:peptidoglycan/LPS O-acetylase OafA/YrhL